MELQVKQVGNSATTGLSVSEGTFGCEFNEGLIHQVVTAYRAGGRAGTKAQKTRSDVSGGGAKPWRQKGTGRARSGTIRSPIWEGGGVTFAARPRDHSQKVNRKMYRQAISSILSELIRQDRLIVVDDLKLESHKTRELLNTLKQFELDRVLIIVDQDDKNLSLASRNVMSIDVRDALHVNPVSLVGAEKVLITVAAIKKLEETLS